MFVDSRSIALLHVEGQVVKAYGVKMSKSFSTVTLPHVV